MKTYDLSRGAKSEIRLEVSGLTKTLRSSVEIGAAIDKVWEAFTRYEAWGEWNSFIPMVKGDVKEGNAIEIRVAAPGLKGMVFKPKVFAVREKSEVSWGGGFLFLYNGVHEYLFERIGADRTRFVQVEKFQGPIVLFMDRMIRRTAIGYMNMNEEFKDRLERA